MATQDNQTDIFSQQVQVSRLKDMAVFVNFSGDRLSSDGGLALLRETEAQVGVVDALAKAMKDGRHPGYCKHSLRELLLQRIGQIACGYEDANDSNELRKDPMIKLFAGRLPDSDPDLASQPTQTRLENSVSRTTLYRMAAALVDVFLHSYDAPPEIIVLDFDETADIVHGGQQLRLFNAHVGDYCFMPLHVYEGLSGKLITTVLRPGKRMSGKETRMIYRRIVAKLRQVWPDTIIVLRGDSHFTSPEILNWCDAQANVQVVLGLSTNKKLKKRVQSAVQYAKHQFEKTGSTVRSYHEFRYRAATWHRAYRVVARIEYSDKGENVCFVVTDFEQATTASIYEDIYCARGTAESYIKDHKRYLKSDRTSCHRAEANQFRLFLASAAYVLLHALRQHVLRNTPWRNATFDTIRLRVLKIGTRVREMKSRIKIELPCSYPNKAALTNSFKLFALLSWQT